MILIKKIHQTIKRGFLFVVIITAIFLNSCYYDNVEELYPAPIACDTTNITFSNDVFPAMEASCISCHSGGAPAGNVNLETYSDIVASVNSGGLMGTIKHESGWSPMPKNGNKLDDCTITKLDVWIADGMLNN